MGSEGELLAGLAGGMSLICVVIAIFFILHFLLAHYTGVYARKRGREYGLWFFLSLIFGFFALILLAVMSPANQYQEALIIERRERRQRVERAEDARTRVAAASSAPLAGGWVMLRPDTSAPRQIQLRKGDNWVGRSSECLIVLDDESVSRRHARISYRGNGVFEVADGGSRNGTRVNGQKVSKATLNDDDIIYFGDAKVIFKSARQ